jgi:hypothetical protein
MVLLTPENACQYDNFAPVPDAPETCEVAAG